MKPTDNSLDEALQRALQRKFDGFEAVPSPALSERVFSRLKGLSQDTSNRLQALILLLLSLGIGGWVAGNLWTSKNERTPAAYATPTGNRAPGTVRGMRSLASPPHFQKPHQSAQKQAATAHTLPASAQISDEERKEVVAGRALGRAADPGTSTGPVRIQASRQMPRPYLPPAALAGPEIKSIAPAFAGPPPAVRRHQLRGVFAFSPTSTFQRLTVLPQADVRFQNFRLPSSLSPQAMVYALRAGLESRGFQLLVQYNRFQQDISYEIGSEVYIIKPQQFQAPTVVREGIVQTDRLTFQLVGIALHKRYSLGSSTVRDAFVDTGASLSHDLTTAQNLAWGTVGIGKSWPVSPHTRLAIAPNVGFSLNRIKTNNDAFRSRYFHIGLAIEWSFGLK